MNAAKESGRFDAIRLGRNSVHGRYIAWKRELMVQKEWTIFEEIKFLENVKLEIFGRLSTMQNCERLGVWCVSFDFE